MGEHFETLAYPVSNKYRHKYITYDNGFKSYQSLTLRLSFTEVSGCSHEEEKKVHAFCLTSGAGVALPSSSGSETSTPESSQLREFREIDVALRFSGKDVALSLTSGDVVSV